MRHRLPGLSFCPFQNALSVRALTFHSTERPISVPSTIVNVSSSSEMFHSAEIPEQRITGFTGEVSVH